MKSVENELLLKNMQLLDLQNKPPPAVVTADIDNYVNEISDLKQQVFYVYHLTFHCIVGCEERFRAEHGSQVKRKGKYYRRVTAE